jgi:DNA-directed RNA polymerase alpha subunit
MVLCLELRVERDGSIYGRYRVGSFKRGYGVSIAATLRRAMLSELPGIALTAVDIKGVAHEYCTMRGVRESVLDITCNLKEVVLSGHLPPRQGAWEGSQAVFGHLSMQGPTTVRGRDLKLPAGLRCVNPEQYIATLAHDGVLRMRVLISTGKNYILHTSARNKALQTRRLLPIDANFMPIRKVNFILTPNQSKTSLEEELMLEIWSNGSIEPFEGVRRAATSLIHFFAPFQRIRPNGSQFYRPFPLPLPSVNLMGEGGRSRPPMWRASSKLSSGMAEEAGRNSLIRLEQLIEIGNFDLSLKTYTYLKRRGIGSLLELVSLNSEMRRVMPKEIVVDLEAHLCRSFDGIIDGGVDGTTS